MLSLSVIFLLLNAQFVFAVQIIVYAGAVMVLFLFVIALLGPARELGRGRLRFQGWLSALFVLVLLGLMWGLLQGVQYRQPDQGDLSFFGTVQSIAVGLFTTYLYPFELTSILLLVAAIGAIYLSRKRIDDSEGGPADGLGPAAGVGGGSPPTSRYMQHSQHRRLRARRRVVRPPQR